MRKLVYLVAMVVALVVLFVACGEEEQLADDSMSVDYDQIIQEILVENYNVIDYLTSGQVEVLVDKLREENIYPGLDGEDGQNEMYSKGLPDCGGYWGAHWEYEKIEPRYSTSGLLYQTGPNCAMWAPGNDCGNDHDDFMLSFYFGRHHESLGQLRPMLRYTSTNWWVRLLLGSLDARVYEQVKGGGTDNYDIYVCIDRYFQRYFHTMRMRKY